MADAKEEQEPKKKGKLVPVLIGVVVVVGAAIGVVAVTAPPASEVEEVEVDLDTLPSQRCEEPFDLTFNLAGSGARGVGRLKFAFDYKAEDPIAAKEAVKLGRAKAQGELMILLLGKTRAQLGSPEGVITAKHEIQAILQRAFFPEQDDKAKGKAKSKANGKPAVRGKITDVYLTELLFQ